MWDVLHVLADDVILPGAFEVGLLEDYVFTALHFIPSDNEDAGAPASRKEAKGRSAAQCGGH